MNYWLMKTEPDVFSIDDLKLKIDSLVGFGLVNLMSGFLLISE